MTAQTPVSTADDPYRVTRADIQDPPVGLVRSLRYLGPGMLMSAAVVGSGELIATTALGAEVGFALLWLVVFSTLVKVVVQMELARWTILTGTPALSGYNTVPPRIGRIGWINVLWMIMACAKILQLGGIVGGVAAACSLLWPIVGEPLSFTSTAVWTVLLVAVTIACMYTNRYSRIERVGFVMVVTFTVSIVVIALGLPLTPFAYDAGDVASGLSLAIPVGAVGAAVAMFGLTGVGADEMTTYTYWCLEKGYARWAGPADGTPEWRDRARGWIKVMQKDAMMSWIVYTCSTMSFYVMGAAILHPQGLVPEGNDMIVTLSRVYTDVLGEWASVLFLIGAIAVLGSTMWASTASNPRLYTNMLSLLGVLDWQDPRARQRSIRVLTVLLPTVWGLSFLFLQSPVLMVQIGGIMGGCFLVAVVAAVWYLRRRDIEPELRGGPWLATALTVSSVAICALGVYTIAQTLGFGVG
ncbi:Nramp family divalent metal transporter [Marinactinospora rubrisoli]|uniref:Nramp family divalent metal transporter n=1 Tax=Marinactinospora rubrisoli TaxID=2715399 RepID=A0ABW2KBL4_9ACTN